MVTKNIDVKLNVRPVFIGFVHQYMYEGPCRFGEGDELKPEYDMMASQEMFKGFKESVESHVPEGVNLLEPIYVERTDEWQSPEEMFETMAEGHENIDLYVFLFGIARGDIYIEFSQRYDKPVCIPPHSCCEETLNTAAMRARGREAYAFYNWEDYETFLRVMRVKKAIANTRVLVASRLASNKSFGGTDNFVCLEDISNRWGVQFRYISAHELMDQTKMGDPMNNHCTPGRKGLNITEEDMVEVRKIAQELVDNAKEVRMDEEKIVDTVRAYYTVQKFMEKYDCNAFTVPCPDLCSSRRLNEEQFTFCLTHSLNNENGIPSACDLDFNSLLTIAALENISGKAAYMGNTNVVSFEDGSMPPIFGNFNEAAIEHVEDKSNLYSLFHATNSRKFLGIREEPGDYSIDSFAYSGFGATIRHDFTPEAGQVITLARFAPDGERIFAGKGTIVASAGHDKKSCDGGLFFRVADNKDFFYKQIEFGCHLSFVYGDYVKELEMLGKLMGLGVVTA